MARTVVPSTAGADSQLALSLDERQPAALTLSVIIPVRNGGENFRRCLQSLQVASPPPAEIIVVADGDSDGSWRIAEDFGAQVIRLPEAGGPARARNAGARVARGDVLVFLDADVMIRPDALALITAALHEPTTTAVFGSYRRGPAGKHFFSQYKNRVPPNRYQT